MAAEQGTHGWHCAAKCLDTLGRVRCIYYNEPSVYRGYPELTSISHGSGCIYTEQASLAPQATATRRSEAGPSVQRSSATALLQDSPDNGLRRAGPRPCVPGLEEGRHFQRPRAARPQSQRAPPGPLTCPWHHPVHRLGLLRSVPASLAVLSLPPSLLTPCCQVLRVSCVGLSDGFPALSSWAWCSSPRMAACGGRSRHTAVGAPVTPALLHQHLLGNFKTLWTTRL